MALGDDYATIALLKNRLGIVDVQDDTRLTGAVSTASRDVEHFCHRQFNKATVATARDFYTWNPAKVVVDDFWTQTGLAVSIVGLDGNGNELETALTATQYRSEPLGGISEGVSGWPWWRLLNLGDLAFPDEDNGLTRVTAQWGWSAVPVAIVEATLILAEEYFKLKEAPWGVANWGDFGPIRVQDNKKVVSLLMRYRRGGIRVA